MIIIATMKLLKKNIDEACRHVMMRQGVLGVRVKIMLAHDPEVRR